MDTVGLLASAFILSVVALLFFIWSQRKSLLDASAGGAEVIFSAGEVGVVEDPAATVSNSPTNTVGAGELVQTSTRC